MLRFLFVLLLCCRPGFADPLPTDNLIAIEQPLSPSLPLQNPDHPPSLPSSEEMTYSYQHAFVRMILSLVGLLVLVFGTFWILKRMSKGRLRFGSNRSIHVLEKHPLNNKTVLYLIEIEGKQLLISESQLEVRALTSIETQTSQ